MTSLRFITVFVLVAGAVLAQSHTLAATNLYCVSTGTQLKQAFADANAAAEGNLQDIRVQAVSINVDAALNFAPAGDKDNKDFLLTGGWNGDCTKQAINAENTTVTFTAASSANRAVTLQGDNHSYLVSGIHFDHFSTLYLKEPDCDLFNICPGTESITVAFNEFSNFTQIFITTSDAQSLTVRNNLFYRGTGGANNGYGQEDPVVINAISGDSSPDISFNTFAKMHCSSAGTAALMFWNHAAGGVVHHNIFNSDCSHDLELYDGYGSKPVRLYNNLYATLTGLSPSDSSGNKFSSDPGFVDAAGDDYNLRTVAPVSVAIDAGMTLPELILDFLTFPAQDLDGGVRLMGTRFDLGALESPGPAPAGYVVTNTNDSGAGSLRQAVYDANHAAGPQKITFNIPGTCPRKIGLLSHLDDVTEDLEIDGFSQPGSARNTVPIATSAILCIEVGPASGTIDYSITVPDTAPAATQLQVYGIAFTGGHIAAPVYLRGGSDHRIQGNAFGGVRPGGTDTLGNTNLFHLVVKGNASDVTIGGAGNGDRNYFGTSLSTAILLRDATSSGHIVRNNYIGLDPGGAVPQPIGNDGVAIVDSSYIQIIGNVIDGASTGISLSGLNATNTSIRSNKIGMDAYGGQGVSAANGDGIYIYNQAHFNEIGSYGTKSGSNTIVNSDYAGVRIDATAGANNTVRPNSIYNNGKSGSGLGIDLGASGPLANDALDADGGPNNGQNSPRLNASVPNPDTTRTISGKLNSLPNSDFRVDVYRSPTCAGGNRGGDAKTLLAAPTTSGATEVHTDADGKATFSVTVNGVGAPAYITAVATYEQSGGSSEIGACFYEDTIFSNGVEVEPL